MRIRRATLLYSAFSKTEVEKRVKNILHYKKATAFVLLFTVLFLTGSMMAFAAEDEIPVELCEKLWRFGRYLFVSGTAEGGNNIK